LTNLGSEDCDRAILEKLPELRLILGAENILTAAWLHSGQLIGASYSAMLRQASNSPHGSQRYSYKGIFFQWAMDNGQ